MHRQIIGCISDLQRIGGQNHTFVHEEALTLRGAAVILLAMVCRRIKVENKERRKR